MNHFDYRNGVLHAEAVNLIDLAEAVGTPFYCYSTATLERHYRVFTEAFAGEKTLVCYAMKANSNQSVLRTLAKLGAGADVVSGGELKRALAAGIPPNKILFSGVGKTETELRAALAQDILCINVESEPELELLSKLAVETGKTARISVRVNPDVDSGSHAKISTGKSENKFGVPLARARASGTPNLFSDLPVEILACDPESTSGLTRTEIRAVLPVSTASRDSNSSSGSDSTLMHKIPAASAARSSTSVLPIPENRIFSGGMPAASARFSSPPETTSAPAPSLASVRSTD